MYLLGFSLFLHIFSALLGCVWLCPEQSCMPLQNEMIIHVSIILWHIKIICTIEVIIWKRAKLLIHTIECKIG